MIKNNWGDWLYHFEDNILQNKLAIIAAYHVGKFDLMEQEHIEMCRQIAGGC